MQVKCGGRSAPSVNLGFLHISETIGARKLRFFTLLDMAKYCFRYDNFSARGRVEGPAPLELIWDSIMSETITARKLKFCT